MMIEKEYGTGLEAITVPGNTVADKEYRIEDDPEFHAWLTGEN
ncbi:hypothetical protein [Thaumasiovibrio subtropicus]|nr:hypothetical protein [Thaumasiovibrio subtropicus]